MKKIILAFSAVIILFSTAVLSQHDDTLMVPVTFYDFSSDGSCPEFEQPHTGGIREGMVADTLDRDGKPVPGANPYMNYYIQYWFRDWADSAQGDMTVPRYDGAGTYLGIGTRDNDKAFENRVIHDTLPFIHLGNEVYEFDRSGYNTDQFFWIDNRGFGNEGKAHNYSFTMEMHFTFGYKPGLIFEFNGDDDVWVFIDGKLAMDLGGVHQPADEFS